MSGAAGLRLMEPHEVVGWLGSTPTPEPGHVLEALEVEVAGVAVGGVLLDHALPEAVADRAHRRTTLRRVETTFDPDEHAPWEALLAAVEAQARRRGSTLVTAAVTPLLLGAFQAAGWAATMTDVGVATGDRAERVLDPTERVRVRPMTVEERRRFVPEAREILRTGMAVGGVLADGRAAMTPVDRRLDALVDDPPADELLLVAVEDGEPVGRFWGTLVPGTDGSGRRDLVGNTIDIAPERRGQGLMRPFMSALEDFVREHGLRDVRGRVYGHDHRARSTLAGLGVGLDAVHLRKDL